MHGLTFSLQAGPDVQAVAAPAVAAAHAVPGLPPAALVAAGNGTRTTDVPPPTGPAVAAAPGVLARGGGSSSRGAEVAIDPPEPEPGAGAGPRDLAGVVRLAVGAGDGPAIAGATLRAHGAFGVLDAAADGEGAFTLALPDGRADLVVRAPGHATLCLPAWADGPLDLHLASALLPPASRAAVPIAGTVTATDGSPAAGAWVVGGDGRGGRFGPVVADQDGRFAGLADVAAGDERPLALFGLLRGGRGAVLGLGLAVDVAADGAADAVAIALHPPTGQVQVAATGAGPAWTEAAVAVRAPNGERATLTRWAAGLADPTPAQAFDLPGLTLEASASAVSADGLRMSAWREDLPGPGTVVPALLPFPAAATTAPAEGQHLDWPAVPGASGYRLALREPGRPAPLWEAWTPRSDLAVRGLPDPLPAELELTITALAGSGAGLRALAALPAADPPRRLRWHDEPALAGRWSSLTVPLP